MEKLKWEYSPAIKGNEGLFPESVESITPDGRTIVIHRNGTGYIEVPIGGGKVKKLDFTDFCELVDVQSEDIGDIISLFGGPSKAVLLSRAVGLHRR